jgi:tetratricopeptide (TPR) repeat protein
LKARRTWLIPGFVALVLFVGGVASNLVASDLEPIIKPYRRWVWVVFAVALIVAVITAIVDARGSDESPTIGQTRIVNASAERSVAIGDKVEGSTIITGTAGDIVGRDKIIINQAAGSTVNALHQLRAPVGDFVGREQEIETLINALRNGNRACVSGISGMGGIGKTELALLVAEHLADDYPDAQFFINLQGTDAKPRAPQDVMATCIRAFLGPEAKLPEDLNQLSQYYRSQLSGKRALLLLDNAAGTAQVQPLLPPPGSALLVTSRQAIALPGMTPLTLNPFTGDEARKLLLEIAPHAGAAANQICALCGYLPLAIRAAGSLLAVTADLDPVDYVSQLNDERKRLERIGTEGVEIGVAASFNLSYERLAPEAAFVFRLLSVFPGTFDAAAEEVICTDTQHARLSDLARRSLVLYDSSTKRYRLHDLARLFADSKLSDEERAVAHKRHARHYNDVLAAADNLYLQGGESLARGLALFDLEWNNIQAGHAWVAAQGVEADEDIARLGVSYPDTGVYLLNLRLHAREWIRWMEIALAAARRLKNRQAEGNALGNLGIAYRDLGETQRAIEFHQQHLAIAREIGNRSGEGTALGSLGTAYRVIGETQRAIELFEQRLIIARELGDRRSEGNVLNNLGLAYKDLGDTERAIQCYEQNLTIAREIGDRMGEGNALGNLGVVHRRLGKTEQAIKFYEQALLIDRELGDCRGEATDRWNISLALDQLGERDKAIKHAERSFEIYQQLEDPQAAKVRAQLAAWRGNTG